MCCSQEWRFMIQWKSSRFNRQKKSYSSLIRFLQRLAEKTSIGTSAGKKGYCQYLYWQVDSLLVPNLGPSALHTSPCPLPRSKFHWPRRAWHPERFGGWYGSPLPSPTTVRVHLEKDPILIVGTSSSNFHTTFRDVSLFSTCQELKIESPTYSLLAISIIQQVLYSKPGSPRFLGWAQAGSTFTKRPKEVKSLQSRNAQMDVQNVIRRSAVRLHLTNSRSARLYQCGARHITNDSLKKTGRSNLTIFWIKPGKQSTGMCFSFLGPSHQFPASS